MVLSVLILASALSGCYDIAGETPECMVKKIKQFNKANGCDDRSVGQYEFQGQNVYVMSAGTCGADMAAEVLDSDCNLLGTLGGIAGNMKINGVDFSTAVFIQTVWKNDGR